MSKKTDRRLHFVAQAINRRITDDALLANEWYVTNGAARLDLEQALTRFAQWIPGRTA